MRAFVTFRQRTGELRELVPGDLIGRIWTAALSIPDPLVSEAHALVSLREGALKLLGLRGRLAVGGRAVTEVTLSVGLKIGLSPRTELEVVEVHVPEALIALDLPGVGLRPLAGVVSLIATPALDCVAGAHPEAFAVVWSDGLGWFARLRDGSDREVVPGTTLSLDGHTIPVVAVTLGASGHVTTVDPVQLDSALHLVVRYDTVHIHREGAATVVVDGIAARIVSDLATAGVPMGWTLLAAELWPNETDPLALRRNWDAALSRLRRKLKEARIRPDLVRADRSGNFELFLSRRDRVDDQT